MTEYLIGLDLGQKRDFTATAILEKVTTQPRLYHLRHLERIKLDTSYIEVVERICSLLRTGVLCGSSTLVMDATGVGLPVLDLIRKRGISPVAVTITGGTSVSGGKGA